MDWLKWIVRGYTVFWVIVGLIGLVIGNRIMTVLGTGVLAHWFIYVLEFRDP